MLVRAPTVLPCSQVCCRVSVRFHTSIRNRLDALQIDEVRHQHDACWQMQQQGVGERRETVVQSDKGKQHSILQLKPVSTGKCPIACSAV